MKQYTEDHLIDTLRDCEAIRYGDFTLSSGKKSRYYIDIKKATSIPKVLKLISEMASAKIRSMQVDRIAGVALGGVPLATAVSLITGYPLLLIRKSEKGYGTGGRFVGDVRKGETVVLIEDVTTSGGSVIDAVDVLRSEGVVVNTVVAVVDREEGAMESLRARGIKLVPLVRASRILEKAAGKM
ncbi:orotate phosphoribosyltransferase [Methanohalophilus sp.]|uniref:orotate phosphoribosyltransferase n=1 Tax=Methanohalophilus sp. TaxID=1966352 RepID=UPI00260424B9|nr:orotate phosphoribosyltransferase [Methanohalophilus sp.]MDK2892680.1 orotate phosphoribosyltransferase [Methanohalophilus sp.]